MSEIVGATPPHMDIPERCLGCPHIAFLNDLYTKRIADNEAYIASHADEYAELDAQFLGRYLGMAADVSQKVAGAYTEKTLEDITRIRGIVEEEPDVAEMPVQDFIRARRTEENGLGDMSIIPVLEMIYRLAPEADELAQLMTVDRAVDMMIKALEGLNEVAKTRLLIDSETINQVLADTDRVAYMRKHTKEKADEFYTKRVRDTVATCTTGPVEYRAGIFKKRIERYCGSIVSRSR